MSLNWTLDKIADWETVCYMEAPCDIPSQFITEGDRMLNPVTNALIWATLSVDLPGITRENFGEFYARLHFVEELSGPYLIRAEVDGVRPEGSAAFITVDEVIDHIGLTANVTTQNRVQWFKRFWGDLDASKRRAESRFSENLAAAVE